MKVPCPGPLLSSTLNADRWQQDCFILRRWCLFIFIHHIKPQRIYTVHEWNSLFSLRVPRVVSWCSSYGEEVLSCKCTDRRWPQSLTHWHVSTPSVAPRGWRLPCIRTQKATESPCLSPFWEAFCTSLSAAAAHRFFSPQPRLRCRTVNSSSGTARCFNYSAAINISLCASNFQLTPYNFVSFRISTIIVWYVLFFSIGHCQLQLLSLQVSFQSAEIIHLHLWMHSHY